MTNNTKQSQETFIQWRIAGNPVVSGESVTEAIMTIHPDGRVTTSDRLKPTETAALVLDQIKTMWLKDAQATKIRELQDRIKRMEEAAQRVDDAAHSIQDWSGTVLGDALDELNNAKEDKGGGIASREQLPHYFERIAFVYRNEDGIIKVVGNDYAKSYENNPDWEHLATLDSFRWIECLLNNTQKERIKQIKEIKK